MTRGEFINWLKEKTHFFVDTDYGKEQETYWTDGFYDYSRDQDADRIEILDSYVIFKWEELYWGGRDYHNQEYSFEDFISSFNNNSLKW